MKMIDKTSGRNVQPSLPKSASAVPPHPLDGSQYHNVIEEQLYSELAPTAEEQMPCRFRHLADPEPVQPHPDDPSISVGPQSG